MVELLATVLLVAHPAPSPDPGPAAPAADRDLGPGTARPVEWSPLWPRFRDWEYGGTFVLAVTSLFYEMRSTTHAKPRWTGGILFDGAARSWLRATTAEGRARAGKISDMLWLGGGAFPLVVDLPVALIAHRKPEVAWQMLMMDLEAFAVAGLLNRVLELEVGRARPSTVPCRADAGYDELCGSTAQNVSFPSGHTLGIATSAGLTCVHHRYLPLFGSPLADAGACAVMSLATVATALTRVMADRHHASDVVFGATLGFGVGYGVPWLLHYRAGAASGGNTPERGSSMVLLPLVAPGTLGLGLAGTL